MNKILIGIPTQEVARYAMFYDCVDMLERPDNTFITRAHGQSPARNRNLIIEQAIKTDCTHVFFIDDDCILPPNTLTKLLAHNKDVITGLYLMRNFPHKPIVFDTALDDGRCLWHPLKNEEKGLIEIVATGLGACLIKIEVFKKIREFDKYWVTLGELEQDHWCDDLSFFKRVRQAGYKIYCDTTTPVGHIAKVTVWPNMINNEWHVSYDTDGSDVVSIKMVNLNQPSLSWIPGKMKAPGDIRPTWRNGIIQIHITRACDLSCNGCTQGSNLAGKPVVMSVEQFEEAVISLKNYYGVIGIFGGNPCIHPKFPEICEVLAKHIPFEQRGLWSNNLNGHGKLCKETFNPAYSNLNIHGGLAAYNEIKTYWPEANPKGLLPSRHSPPYVALKDMQDMTDAERWQLIINCDINQYWSAMVCVFRNELRAFFCELAGAQSMLHEHEPDYPDTGLPLSKDWWQLPLPNFEQQIHKHCMECGIPLRGSGSLDNGQFEYVSKTHESIYKLKRPNGKVIKLISSRAELGTTLEKVTDYIENGALVS